MLGDTQKDFALAPPRKFPDVDASYSKHQVFTMELHDSDVETFRGILIRIVREYTHNTSPQYELAKHLLDHFE